jgi:hypothetical protein
MLRNFVAIEYSPKTLQVNYNERALDPSSTYNETEPVNLWPSSQLEHLLLHDSDYQYDPFLGGGAQIDEAVYDTSALTNLLKMDSDQLMHPAVED